MAPMKRTGSSLHHSIPTLTLLLLKRRPQQVDGRLPGQVDGARPLVDVPHAVNAEDLYILCIL